MLDDIKTANFNTPSFKTPDWAKFGRGAQNANLGPRGPVAPEDLVDAAGQCAAEVPVAQPAPPPTPAPVAAPAEPPAEAVSPEAARASGRSRLGRRRSRQRADAARTAAGAAAESKTRRFGGTGWRSRGLQPEGKPGAGGAPVVGGIALGMTECQAVRRAGQPGQVSIGSAEGGERKVVLSYLSGP